MPRPQRRLERLLMHVYRTHGPEGIMARTWSTGSTVLWIAILLCTSLLLYYL